MQVVVVAVEPGARVVREDGLGAAEDDGVVRGRQLEVVVPDVAAPVLGAGGADEACGCAEGADGADGLEDEVGVFGEDVRGPGVLLSCRPAMEMVRVLLFGLVLEEAKKKKKKGQRTVA